MEQGICVQNGRFFYKGKPIFISSLDCETLAADTRFDFREMLDLFIRHGFNKNRLWAHCWLGPWTGPPEVFLRPWKSVPGPSGKWEDHRWDLDAWNDAYWERMRDFCAAALERDFIVEISLLSEWVRDFGDFRVRGIPAGVWWRDELYRPEWNSRFNVNGVFSSNEEGDFWPQFCDLDHPEKSRSGKTLFDYQKAYFDKVIKELDEFPNVYFELFNEFPPFPQKADGPPGIDRGAAWQNHWARYLKENSHRPVGVNAHQIGAYQAGAVGVEHFQEQPFVDILNFHWFGGIGPLEFARIAQPLHRYGKVIANNEGEWRGVTGPALEPDAWATRMTPAIWGIFIAGSHYSYTEFPPDVGNERWLKTAQRFRVLRSIAESVSFAKLWPLDDGGGLFDGLISQGPAKHWRLIANPGEEYLAYFWLEANETAVLIDLPEGNYNAEWYDVRDGRTLLAAGVESRGERWEIPSPSPAEWEAEAGLALVIRRRNQASN